MTDKNTAKRHNLFLHTEHEEALKEIKEMKNLSELKTSSKIIRFIILDYYNLIKNPKSATPDTKINAMGKDISIILNLLCSMIASTPALNLAGNHIRNEDVLLYWQSLNYVEGIMNDRKSGHYKKSKPSIELKEMMKEKHVSSPYLEQLEREKRDDEFEKIFSVDANK